jgi:hypothetical protein
MAKRSLSCATVTTAATANTTNLANTSYLGLIQGGSTTQRVNLIEVTMGGQSSATSQPQIIILARDSTVGATVVAGGTTDAALDASTAALAAPAVTGNSATTLPQRSSTLQLLNFSFNAYGGFVRWLAKDGEEISLIGNSASLGEISLSAFTGTTAGPIGGTIIYEPF